MKFSELWLREWVNPAIDSEALSDQITMAGLEVDGVEPVAGSFNGVVVGEVVECGQHPNADKLRVTKVNVGGERLLDIVCGAPNCRQGLKVAVATIGAVLPGDFKIKAAKLRGEPSEGMLCSFSELGISDDHSGIIELPADAPIGTDIREYLKLDDNTIEISVTPNRADCLGIIGVARDVAVLNKAPLNAPEITPVAATIDDVLPIQVDAPQACPRYLGRVVKGINVKAPTPLWMKEKLRRCGIRSIDAVVDVTNYVLLELGQPMHAFDRDRIEGGIVVRMAKEGETLVLLDGSEAKLDSDTLVIADHNKALAMGGIFGGEHSGVNDETQNVLLECAFFSPLSITGRARRHGLHTDASHRYERGVDPALQYKALERATRLLIDLCGGEAGPVIDVTSKENLPTRATITLRRSKLDRLIGHHIADAQVTDILQRLGCEVTVGEGEWQAVAPSWRFDMEIEEDLVEEVARVYGYNNIPSTVIRGVAEAQLTPQQQFLRKAEQTMVGLGYYGTLTYSFTSPKCFDRIGLPADSKLRKTITITNPLGEDTSIMRTTTLPCMLDVLATNYKNRNAAVALYEIGKEYLPTGPDTLPNEPNRLTIGMYGGDADFFALKGTVDALLKELRLPKCTYVRPSEAEGVFEECCALHPGRSAVILSGETPIGYLGELHPTVQKTYGIGTRTYVAKLLVQEMAEMAEAEVTYRPLPKFPAITRDLSLLCDDALPVGKMEEAIEQAAGKLLEEVTLFDVYKGDQIAAGKKSVSFSLRLRSHEGTLTDEQADAAMKRVLKALAAMDAVLREA